MTNNASVAERKSFAWRESRLAASSRMVADEKAVALTYDGTTYAVMMATPDDLADFGIGFSLTEGVISQAGEIRSLELVETDLGTEVRMWLEGDRSASLAARRRAIVGPVGCGLCGIESLEQARLAPRRVPDRATVRAGDLLDAMAALAPLQHLNRQTHAMHAAAFWDPAEGIRLVREDVGRHNALDKLVGALARDGRTGANGAVLLTSRVSVEMVQKTAILGAPILVAVSAPTTLAIETADQAGITLIAVARQDGYEIFTHGDRIVFPEP